MKSVILPFNDEVECVTYQYVAYLLGVMKPQLKDQYLTWLSTKYINCYFDLTNRDCRFTDSDGWDIKSGLSTSSYLEMDHSLVSMKSFDLVGMLERMLENGYYISGDFDEYYIPKKSAYQKYHYNHDYLLFGFDPSRKVFMAAGYLQDGKYHTFEISYCDYLQSLDGLSRPLIPMAFRHIVEGYQVALPVEKILFRINAYIDSKNDMEEIESNKVYGISAWKAVEEYVLSSEDRLLDMRIFRLFWEHKIIMKNRLQVLLQNGIGNSGILDSYTKIQSEAEKVFLLALKLNYCPNERVKGSLAEKISFACEEEEKCLNAIVYESRHLIEV